MTSHGQSMSRVDVEKRYDQVAELTLRGFSAPQIAEKLNCSTRLVFRGRERRGLSKPSKSWTPEEIETADRLLKDGCSYREVGRTLGRNATSVESRFPRRSQCTPADGPRLRRMLKELEGVR